MSSIETGKWTNYNDYTKVWYAAKGRTSQQLTRQVEVVQPDVLFIVGLYSWYFTMVPLLFCKAPLKILSARGMLHPGALSQKSSKKRMYLRALKLWGIGRKVWLHATDEAEVKYIQNQLGQNVRITIAENIPMKCSPVRIISKSVGELRMVTLALISPMKNILKVLRALHLVKGRVNYEIFGAIKNDNYWEECRSEIRMLPDNIKVDYKGVVPFNVTSDALASGHVFIMPSESENFGHSIYESLAIGRPVITSMNTPWNHLKQEYAGLNVEPDGSEQLAQAIDFFCAMEEETLIHWSDSAVKYAKRHFDLSRALQQNRNMFSLK